MIEIAFQRLHPDARVPGRAHADDAGFDLHAVEAATLAPGERAAIGCGFAIALPEGAAALVLPRSGLALREGIGVLNAPGLIDAGYRGEVRVILVNHDPRETRSIAVGDRIAQLLPISLSAVRFLEVDVLPCKAEQFPQAQPTCEGDAVGGAQSVIIDGGEELLGVVRSEGSAFLHLDAQWLCQSCGIAAHHALAYCLV